MLIPLLAANHKAIFNNVGATAVDYPYYDPKNIGLAFDEFLNFLRNVPRQSVILIHACAHNPTGVDPTREQWKEIVAIFVERGLFAFLDTAYQGFASGSLDDDAWAVRYFTEQNVPLLVCQSFAKNMGLYVRFVSTSLPLLAPQLIPSPHLGRASASVPSVLSRRMPAMERAERSESPANFSFSNGVKSPTPQRSERGSYAALFPHYR